MRAIDEIAPDVLAVATDAIRFDLSDDNSATYKFNYADDNWNIDGTIAVSGEWRTLGDGYETPRETLLTNGSGELISLSVECFDAETDERISIAVEAVDTLFEYLNSAISIHMKSCY